MSKPALLLLAAAALLGLGLLGFLLQSGSGSGRSGGNVPQANEAPAAPAKPGELSAPREGSGESPQRTQASELESALPAGVDRESFALAGARWLEVRVILPAGVPKDDAPALVSLSSSEDDRGSTRFSNWTLMQAAQVVGLDDRFEGRIQDDVSWARRAVSGSTTVRVPFPADARSGLVLLQSRYVYAESAQVHLEGEIPPVTIEGELGAYVTGELLPPVDPERAFSADDFELVFLGRDKEGSLDFAALGAASLDVEVRDDLSYEVRALSARKKYFVQTEARGLVDFAELDMVVAPGEHKVLDVPLRRGAWVSGRVLSSSGGPIAGASVSATSRGKGLLFFLENGESATTDEAGKYVLRGLPEGKSNLEVSASGWLERNDLELVLEEGADVAEFDVVLDRGSEVTGLVLWPSGAPAAGARVRIGKTRAEGWSDFQSDATCDPEGRFVLAGLKEGPFDLSARSKPTGHDVRDAGPEGGDWSAILRGVQANTHDLVLTLEEPLSLFGRVVDDTGAPVAEFTVEAEPASIPRWLFDAPSRAFETTDGAFELSGLRPGEWNLSASASGYASPKEPLSVTLPGANGELLITLDRAVNVEGLVVDPAGNPVPEATVRASAGPSGPFGQEGSSQQTGSDAEGRFSLEFPGQALSLVASHEAWAESEPLAVEIGPGSEREDVVLALRVGGTITGEVYAADGSPQAGIRVGAGDMPFWFGQDGQGVTSDASGRFVIEHVTPGKITVTAMPLEDDLRAAMEQTEDEEVAMMGFFSQLRTATVEVADGEEVHVVLGTKTKSPVRVFGTVSEGGEPVVQAGVFAIEEGGSILQGMKGEKTDASGQYSLVLDRPGAFLFSVSIEGLGQSTAEFYVDVPEVPEFEFDLALPLASLDGQVFGPDSSPAIGVSLNLGRDGVSSGPTMMSLSRGRVTDSEGRFRFEHLQPGTYALQVGASTFSSETTSFGATVLDGIVLAENEHRDGLEIHLPAAAKVSGIVRKPDRSPVMGATIFARDAGGRILSDLSTCQSDAAGRFLHSGLPAGSISLFARTSELASREITTRVEPSGSTEVELVLEPAATLVMSLLEGEDPVRGSLVVVDEAGRRVSGITSVNAFEDMISEGIQSKELRVGPVPLGTYTVTGRSPDGKEAKKTVTVREPGERIVKLRLK